MQRIEILTPVVTAFTKDREIDIPANQAIYEFLIRGGVDGIVVLGSTGEFPHMTMDQKKSLAKAAAETIGNRCRLILGIGSACLSESVEFAKYAEGLGIREVMAVSPYYFELDQQMIEDYYTELAGKISQDIIIYNFPGRTPHNIAPETIYRLAAKCPNIIGVKDTVDSVTHTRQIIRKLRPEFPDFQIYCGTDEHFSFNVMSGGNGNIGGISNFAPEVGAAMVQALKDRDYEKVEKYQREIEALSEIYTVADPFFVGVKAAMKLRGVPMDTVSTVPFADVTDEQTANIGSILKAHGLL